MKALVDKKGSLKTVFFAIGRHLKRSCRIDTVWLVSVFHSSSIARHGAGTWCALYKSRQAVCVYGRLDDMPISTLLRNQGIFLLLLITMTYQAQTDIWFPVT